MALSCDCIDDYDWYYEVDKKEKIADKPFKCYGCCEQKESGEEIREVWSMEYDEDGNDINNEIIGALCEECAGLYDSLIELGFCITADWGFVRLAMEDYRDYYAPTTKG